MKTKQDRIDMGIKRLEKLIQETILRYTADIDFDQELSLYDIMMNHFANGDLDDSFTTDVTANMNEQERKTLFALAREFIGVCFSNGDVDYWLDSLENTPISDYNLIAYSIFDSFDFLLQLVNIGGREALELLVSLRACEELRDTALVTYLRNTFVDDRVLNMILVDMSKKNSGYEIFTDEQKGILLSYPEGTLYAYGKDKICVTSPLVLGLQIYNKVNNSEMTMADSNAVDLQLALKEFFRNNQMEFSDEVFDLVDSYRDYVRKNNIVLGTEYTKIEMDSNGELIKGAWSSGDEILGATFDTPYVVGGKKN